MTEFTTIESPPEPWVNAPASMTPDGALLELVGLADVVRWLMTAKRLQFVPAVHAMHKALAGLADLGLYVADGKGLACAVGAGDTFGLDYPRWRRTFSRGLDGQGNPLPSIPMQARSLPDGVTPGVSAALYMVLHQPNESDALISRLAMQCEQAVQLWGCSAAPAVAVNASSDDKKHSDIWDGARLLATKTELIAVRVKNYTQRLSELSGIEETAIRRLIREHKKTLKPSPFPTGGKVAAFDSNPKKRSNGR
ncbi:hypothetical protein [Polaromonas hydrogenivorans]|uniref:Uncharacterized protein n=1 Tax=Polaromonas hydrogenivorans TaxID=335476 RepID=A0AAU7LPF9_9BURK